MQVSPAAYLFNLDWGDDLAEVVVRYAVLAGKTDGGWTVAVGEMLELRIWPLWFRRDARKAGQCGVCVGEQILPACSGPVLHHRIRAIFVAAASVHLVPSFWPTSRRPRRSSSRYAR